MKSDTNKRERIRRISLTAMGMTAPLPAIGVALTGGMGWPWAVVPAVAGVVTVATMTGRRPTSPLPAPVVYPERITRITRVDAYATPTREPAPDLNALRELVAAEPWPGREAA